MHLYARGVQVSPRRRRTNSPSKRPQSPALLAASAWLWLGVAHQLASTREAEGDDGHEEEAMERQH